MIAIWRSYAAAYILVLIWLSCVFHVIHRQAYLRCWPVAHHRSRTFFMLIRLRPKSAGTPPACSQWTTTQAVLQVPQKIGTKSQRLRWSGYLACGVDNSLANARYRWPVHSFIDDGARLCKSGSCREGRMSVSMMISVLTSHASGTAGYCWDISRWQTLTSPLRYCNRRTF